MLFNSYEFLFLFLLPVFFGWLLMELFVSKHICKQKVLTYYLIGVSIIFYGQWNLKHLYILLGSVVFNYAGALWFVRHEVAQKKMYLFVMVVLNLVPLGYYKYSGILNMKDSELVLPLAISFFTFQQIAFWVDLYKKKIELGGFDKYLFFVLFFPQLIAGPIVHYNDLVGQLKKMMNKSMLHEGLVLFSVGLFKKVVLADSLAPYANAAFSDVAVLSLHEAWLGLFAYSFEIYFDFSAYADMAIGLGLLFGFRLPMNFDSPYKSKNIIEFWRRWHITLSEFLKEHLYIPLGGNRKGVKRSVLNLMITMSIGGIWHGAGWTFLLWGFGHGVFLGISHLAKNIKSTFLTFLGVTLLWVLFRADSFSDAITYYGVLMPDSIEQIREVDFKINFELMLLLVSGFIVWFLPNSMKIYKYAHKKSMIVFAGVLFFVSLKVMANTPAMTFVYFNF